MNSKSKRYIILFSSLFILNSYSSKSQNTDFDKKIGEKNAKAADQEFGIYQDEKMIAYVQEIGKRLVNALDETPFQFRFVIADDFIPNAFALPGGYIYVTRGILALVNSEDELACVMAHEITHVVERHSIHQMRRGIIPGLLMLPGEIVSSTLNEQIGNLLNAPIAITTGATSSAHSRKQESEADTKGIELAAKAGYDPSALKDILERLSKAIEVITDQKEKKGWFDDHPFTPDRVTNISKVSKDLKWEKQQNISSNAMKSFDGMVFGDSPQKGIFYDTKFVHADLNFTITFPKEWLTQNESDAVVAVRKDKKAGLYLGLVDASKSPTEYAKEFEHMIEKKHGKKPVTSEVYNQQGQDAYLVVLLDGTKKEPVYIHVLWLKIGTNVFKLIGVAPKLYEESLKVSAKSLRSLTMSEQGNIEIRAMRVAEAIEGETLDSFGKRTNNVLPLKVLAVINGLDQKTKLKASEKIKIAKKEIYKK